MIQSRTHMYKSTVFISSKCIWCDMAYDGIEDMGRRISRGASWDDTSLDEDRFKTEMIAPVNISTYDGGTNDMIITCAGAFGHLHNWILESIKRTMNTNKEHGFYVDSYFNVIGIFEGEQSSIQFPTEHIGNYVLRFHTHPPSRSYDLGTPAHGRRDISNMNGKITSIVCPVPNKPSYTGLLGLVRGVDEFDTGPKIRQPFTRRKKIIKQYVNTTSLMLEENIEGFSGELKTYKFYDNQRVESTKEAIENMKTVIDRDEASYGFTESQIYRREIEEYLND
jgi:hypothetical protein